MVSEKPSVLLVDDEQTIHGVIGMILRNAGYFVDDAKDGVAGLRMFKERLWDLVITDYAMPGMGGGQLAEEIRKISTDVPLILITGFLKADIRVDLFNGILEKPLKRADLLATTSRFLGKN